VSLLRVCVFLWKWSDKNTASLKPDAECKWYNKIDFPGYRISSLFVINKTGSSHFYGAKTEHKMNLHVLFHGRNL